MRRSNPYPGVEDDALRVIRYKAARLAGRSAFADLEPEDLEQELVIDFLARRSKYDPARGAFSTFVKHVVDHKVASLVAPREAAKRDWHRNGVSLNDEVNDGTGECTERWRMLGTEAQERRTGAADPCAQRERDLVVDVNAGLQALPSSHRELCTRLLHQSLSEVARVARVPRSTLQYRLNDIRRRFARAGLDDYIHRRPSTRREHR